MSAILTSAAVGVQLVLAAVLTLLAIRAHGRTGARRMMFLGVAFGALLLQGIVIAYALFTTRWALEDATGWGMFLNALALTVIYLGVLRP